MKLAAGDVVVLVNVACGCDEQAEAPTIPLLSHFAQCRRSSILYVAEINPKSADGSVIASCLGARAL